MNERERIAILTKTLGGPAEGVELGIGDDAAVLDGAHSSGRIVWTIDEQVEGSHFRRNRLAWHDIGWRSFMAAASDVAAMGAAPWCALCAMVLPDDVDDEAFEQIALGQRDAAAHVGAPIVGGNLAHGVSLSIATTLLGTCARAVTRARAQPGDFVWLAGHVGRAAAGWRALEQEAEIGATLEPAVIAWRRPRAEIAAGLAMAPVAHAAVDVSDGLASDVGHIAEASGVRIVLDEAALEADEVLVAAAKALGASPVDLALHGGEDYALAVASPVAIPGFRRVGRVEVGRGLALCGASGERPIESRGYDHFPTPASRPATARLGR